VGISGTNEPPNFVQNEIHRR